MKVVDTKPTYASLKRKEEELVAQLTELREEIKNAESDIIVEKLNIALQCLADVDEMTHGYYCCSIEAYCEGCDEHIDFNVDLAEIIEALQALR